MKILHTEASPGWGGQELRILREAEGMRSRGHEVLLAVQQGGGLVEPARSSGFLVYEIPYRKAKAFSIFLQLIRLIRRHHIEIINTHSSLDAWIGGLVGKVCGCKVIRTRHLSTAVRSGINSRILYNWLANFVVTTCEDAAFTIRAQAKLSSQRCLSIPTGIDPCHIHCEESAIAALRLKYSIEPEDCLAGTLCVLRGWKGVAELLQAAKILEHVPNLKWMIVGSGVGEMHLKELWKALGLEKKVIFTGHLSPPYAALAAMDIFLLLSWANEGVSQASLQAACLAKPLITTTVGGLREVCIKNQTGLHVSPRNSQAVADAVMQLFNDPNLRFQMGQKAKLLVEEKFTLAHTLDQMEKLYQL